MSHELLLQDLRRKSAQRVAAIWRQAESDAVALRAEKEREFAAARELLAHQLKETARAVAEPIARAAEIRALRILDDACRELAGRQYVQAAGQLGQVRQADYEAIFADLVAELPAVSWQEVRVSPLDQDLVRLHFPGAEIVPDPSVIGGFAAASDNGRHRVVSTLQRRLERAWPFALPQLLREVEEELDVAPAP